MIKFVLVAVVAVVVVLIGAIVVLGAVTPRKHVARVSMRVKRAPSDVYGVVADLASWPTWNPTTNSVERAADVNGHAVWKVVDGHANAMPYEIVETTAPSRMVTRIADESLPFGGTWTWSIAPIDGDVNASDVTVVEDGVIKNVVFRALARTVFGYTTTQKTMLHALASKLGDPNAMLTEEWRHVDD